MFQPGGSQASGKEMFYPSPEFAARAHIKSLEQYKAMYKRSIEDPEGFWSEIAGKLTTRAASLIPAPSTTRVISRAIRDDSAEVRARVCNSCSRGRWMWSSKRRGARVRV